MGLTHTLELTDDELDFIVHSLDAMVRINGLSAATLAMQISRKIEELVKKENQNG